MTVDKLTYLPSSVSPAVSNMHLFDIFKGMSMVDRKYHSYASDDGHLKGVLCNITLEVKEDTDFSLWGVGNNWAVRNAMRAFHFKRIEMFERNGVDIEELGAYARTIRPYLDYDGHYRTGSGSYVETNPIGGFVDEDNPNADVMTKELSGGGWDRSQFVTAPGSYTFDTSSGSITTNTLSDEWYLTILGDHEVAVTSTATGGPGSVGDDTWITVSAVKSYIDSKRKPVSPKATDDETLVGQNNPLLQLSSGSITSSDVTEIAEDEQEWTTPYARDSADMQFLTCVGIGNVQGSQTKIMKFHNVFLPAGYLVYSSDAYANLTECQIEIVGVAECREYVL